MLIDLLDEAQVHRDVYIALLNSALRRPGSKARLAHAVGITPQYLSYLCDPDDPVHAPSPALAARLAEALPLERALRTQVEEHMLLARARRLQAGAAPRAGSGAATDQGLIELRAAHQAATFVPDPDLARRQYRSLRDAAYALLPAVDTRRQPLDFAEICLLIHDVQCVLNRPDEALYYARCARTVMDRLGALQPFPADGRFLHYQINVCVAEGVACHNLGLDRAAYGAYQEAETVLAHSDSWHAAFWQPHVARGKINALCRLPRFTLGEVAGLAVQARRQCEQRAWEGDSLLCLMLGESEGRAYLQYGNLGKARRVLDAERERMQGLIQIGPLHQAIFLKTYARFRWQAGDRQEWTYFVQRALQTMLDAGLTHQAQEVRRTYGLALDSVLADLGHAPTAPTVGPG